MNVKFTSIQIARAKGTLIMEENPAEEKKNDSKYRRYVAALEKCLQSFESVNEWADVISFLSRLGKVFQSFPTFKEIPFKLNLAKRLAQCLNPALPAGVHQKTLEVYELVFRKIGNEGLAKDLSVYSFGLFPFFEHSATLVKNSLLELYEVYLVPLGVELIPSLRPLVLSIILGLEEESSDYFIKVNNLLNRIKQAVGTSEFYDAIWTGLLISPHHRLAIINFLLKNIPLITSNQDLIEICVNNTRLVSSALSAALQDQEQLVVRGSLEILLKHFPTDKRFFELQQLVELFQASMSVLTRRDMSLTRRFYTWILSVGSTETETLSEYNSNVLILAFNGLINKNLQTFEEISRPFKLLVFILDKPVISDPVLKECMFPLIAKSVESSRILSSDDFKKVLTSANLLFRMIELDSIWGTFLRQVNKLDFQNPESIESSISTITFAIDFLSVFDDSSPMIQAHILVNYILFKVFSPSQSTVLSSAITPCIDLCIKLIERISSDTVEKLELNGTIHVDTCCSKLANDLLTGSNENSQTQDVPMNISLLLINDCQTITRNCSLFFQFSDEKSNFDMLLKSCLLLSMLLFRVFKFSENGFDSGIQALMETMLKKLEVSMDINEISALLSSVKVLLDYSNINQVRKVLIDVTLPLLWSKYNDSSVSLKNNVNSLVLKICKIFPSESDIYFAKVLSSAVRNRKYQAIEVFTIFWDSAMTEHQLIGVPLRLSVLILVESMSQDEFKFRKCSSLWMFSISKFLDRFLVPSLSTCIDILECALHESSNSSSSKKLFRRSFDKGPLIYYFNIIEKLLLLNDESVFNYISVSVIDPYLLIQMTGISDLIKQNLEIEIDNEKNNYVNMLITLCLPLIIMEEQLVSKINFAPVRVAALDMLLALLPKVSENSLCLSRILIESCILKLNLFVFNIFDTEKQAHFIKILNCIFINPILANSVTSHDIVCLAESNKKALELIDDLETMQSWCNFAISLGLLPNANVEIVMSILNDSLVYRLQTFFKFQTDISLIILSSVFQCVTKLSIFYLAAKSNIFSDHAHLKHSLSCLLNEIKTDSTQILSSAKLSSSIKIGDFEKVIIGFLDAHFWLEKNINDVDSLIDINGKVTCQEVLKESCFLLYSTNRSLITEVLISVFSKYNIIDSKHNFHQFVKIFYGREASEFIKLVLSIFKTSKETWKNQETLLKFLLEFSKFEDDSTLILDIWNILVSQLKDLSSSGFKFKSILWLLLENCCHLMERVAKIDNSRLIKDFDLISKLLESCILYAAKLNDPSQWTCKSEELLISVDSDQFTSLILDSVKDKNVGRCMNSICRILLPNIHIYFQDPERVTSTLSVIVGNLVSPNLKGSHRYSLMGRISAFCLYTTLNLSISTTKIWRKDLWEAFFDNSFLWMPDYYFTVVARAFRIIAQEPDRFSEILGKFSTSATAAMFLSKDSEILSKALNIRRLSFLTFWGNFDAIRMHLPSLQEKLVELTKYYNGFILGEIFVLIRVMLLRLNDESISSLWPLIMTELVQLFENMTKLDSIQSSDLYAIFQACKLIDMMLTLRTSSILLYHWLFFDSVGKDRLFLKLQSKIKGQTSEFDIVTTTSGSSKRRPLLSISSVKTSTELLYFLENAKSHLSHDFVMIQNLDMEFIDNVIEKDLLESLEIK